MAEYEFMTVDVFTARRFGGNPLAVIVDARGLDHAAMQAIAAEFGYPETTFVLPPDNPQHHAKVRIFTPRAELGFAGHPNIGTGFVLAQRSEAVPEHFTFEEKSGLVRVHLERGLHGKVTGARVAAPHSLELGIHVPEEVLAACVGLRPEDLLLVAHPPIVASVGLKFVIAEVSGLETLRRASPDLAAIRAAAKRFPEAGEGFPVLLYTKLDDDATRLSVRAFAPLLGVWEDAATGSANAALAALLTSLAPGDELALTYEISQGSEMGRPSRIVARAHKSADGPVLASVSGDCTPVMQGRLEV